MTKIIRIISLGELITPDVTKAVLAYSKLISKKNPTIEIQEAIKLVSKVLEGLMETIEAFKLGKINEDDFNLKMTNALYEKTKVNLSKSEFNECWNAMNPSYSTFKDLLNEAIKYNNEPNQKMIFISYTNPKDIDHLTQELKSNNISFKQDINQSLQQIAGIDLYLTYNMKISKPELIKHVINKVKSNQLDTQSHSILAKNTSTIFGKQQDFRKDVKYIRGVNNINDPILANDFEIVSEKVEKMADELLVDTILWNKLEQSFSEVVNNEQLSREIKVSKL